MFCCGFFVDIHTAKSQHTFCFFRCGRYRAAVDFLEYRFSLTDSQMLALTSKGSVLTTIAFRSEEPTAGMVNGLETLYQ